MEETAGLATRRAAWRVLRRVHTDEAWSSYAVDRAVGSLPAGERAFAANLAYMTLRWEGTLDWALAQVLRPGDVDPAVRDVLRLGAYQLAYGRTPAHAAVSTSVALARREIGPHVTGFVNGVLRALDRRWSSLPWPDEADGEGLGLATGYAGWIVAEAQARFGDDARAVLDAGNEPPGVTLRARGQRSGLLTELRAQGLEPTAGRHAAAAVRVPGAVPAALPAVTEGRATVTDEASMLVAEATVSAAGAADRPPLVLDACAGPGGKAGHLADLGCAVVAADRWAHRARRVADLAELLGVDLAVAVADATAPPWPPGQADVVLLDVPCTGLGVVRRRPELRWRRRAGDPTELARLQAGILAASADLPRRGGALVYAACTWTIAETTGVLTRFLASDARYRAEDPVCRAGSALPDGPGVLLRPDLDDTDGMYLAVLRRQ